MPTAASKTKKRANPSATAKSKRVPVQSVAPKKKEQPLDETARFNRDGCIAIENAFDPAFVAELAAAHAESLKDWKSRQIVVGGFRFMVTFELKGPFLDERLLANPRVFPLIQSVLGKDCVLDNVTSVVALPRAPAQHVHKDGMPLFSDAAGASLPCHALTLVIPFIDLTPSTGTTALYPGTHREPLTEEVPKGEPMLPYMKVGGCYLMDYRLIHLGTANTGTETRPILYVVYSRPWFTDFSNFTELPPLRVAPESLPKMSGQMQWLFSRPKIAADHARHG